MCEKVTWGALHNLPGLAHGAVRALTRGCILHTPVCSAASCTPFPEQEAAGSLRPSPVPTRHNQWTQGGLPAPACAAGPHADLRKHRRRVPLTALLRKSPGLWGLSPAPGTWLCVKRHADSRQSTKADRMEQWMHVPAEQGVGGGRQPRGAWA